MSKIIKNDAYIWLVFFYEVFSVCKDQKLQCYSQWFFLNDYSPWENLNVFNIKENHIFQNWSGNKWFKTTKLHITIRFKIPYLSHNKTLFRGKCDIHTQSLECFKFIKQNR